MNASLKTRKNVVTFFTYLVLILGSISMIFPFVWMVLTSFKTQAESMAIPPQILPSHWNLDSFVKALQSLPFTNLYLNTGLLILFRVIFAVVFSSMAGYAFAKLEFPCKKLLFSLVLIQMMLPSQIFIIPQYQMLAKMGATNSIFALVFPGLVSAFGTFFLRQAYLGIPNEIAEAAYLDGCNKWQTFVKVMLPLTGPSMAALAIFTAVFAYADLMWPDLQHRSEHDDPVCRPFHPERSVHHQLPGADGRQPAGHDSHGDPVPDLPEAVHSGHCHDRR